MAEWLRRWTRNPMGSPRAGSNPARSVPIGKYFSKIHAIFSASKQCIVHKKRRLNLKNLNVHVAGLHVIIQKDRLQNWSAVCNCEAQNYFAPCTVVNCHFWCDKERDGFHYFLNMHFIAKIPILYKRVQFIHSLEILNVFEMVRKRNAGIYARTSITKWQEDQIHLSQRKLTDLRVFYSVLPWWKLNDSVQKNS